jgi:hypothetical protein
MWHSLFKRSVHFTPLTCVLKNDKSRLTAKTAGTFKSLFVGHGYLTGLHNQHFNTSTLIQVDHEFLRRVRYFKML